MRLIRTFVPVFLLAAASSFAATSDAFFAYSSQSTTLTVTTDAGLFNLSSIGQGWYTENGDHTPGNTNYIVGVCGTSDACNGDDLARNNFFAFDLEGISGSVLSASLFLPVPGSNGYISSAPSLLYRLFNVTTTVPALVGGTGGVSAFNDLGSGILFGTHIATNSQEGSTIEIALTAAALSAIEDGIGGDFAIGGTLATSSVPEPSSFMLAGSVLALAAAARLRRR